ncbi:MAG: hypothetical protein HYS98_03710 [Deltaproteobacteria bacterium]|nr:hypothetical protein [Deltaproteobacteria bacterium]
MKGSLFIIGIFLLIFHCVCAQDPRIELIDSSKLTIITHPMNEFDQEGVAKDGIKTLINYSQVSKIPTVILGRSSKTQGYIDDDSLFMRRDSSDGHFDFKFNAHEVYLAGGYFSACFYRTFTDVFLNFWNSDQTHELIIYVVYDGLYKINKNAKMTSPAESYKGDVENGLIDEESLSVWAEDLVHCELPILDCDRIHLKIILKNALAYERISEREDAKTLRLFFLSSSDLPHARIKLRIAELKKQIDIVSQRLSKRRWFWEDSATLRRLDQEILDNYLFLWKEEHKLLVSEPKKGGNEK